MGELTGTVALVTGASRGFGRATALALAERGADLVLGYRASAEPAQRVAEEIRRSGGRAEPMQADLGERSSVERLAETALGSFGRIDVLVNNAGVMDVAPFTDQDPETWARMLDVNVAGTLLLTRLLLPPMLANGSGRVINLASQYGHTGAKDFAVYSGTKAFLLAFTRSLAREVGPGGVTVNAVCPGSILTDMNREVYPTPDAIAARAAELPLRRLGEPRDVAAAVLFLATESGRFVTGQCIDVNGGSTMV